MSSRSIRFAPLMLIALIVLPPILYAQTSTSQLWGTAGELWNPTGRLPDFSYAGYHAGEKQIPTVPVVTNVKTYGAKGDGVTNDTVAFKNAIAAANNGAVLVPKGRYIINEVLYLNKSNVVLRGEGSGSTDTVLIFNKSLTDMLGPHDMWKWGNGGVIWAGHKEITGAPIRGSRIAYVTNEPNRGDRVLRLSQQVSLKKGDYITLHMADGAPDHSMSKMLHNGVSDSEWCTWQETTRFVWPVQVESISGLDVTLAQPLRIHVRQEWNPEITVYNAFKEIGIEHLRIEFPELPMKPHLEEDGYNAIALLGVANSWVKNVTVINADSGPSITLAKHVTITNFTHAIRNRPSYTVDPSYTGAVVGHHGFSFNFNSADNLITDFVTTRFAHDVTVGGLSNGNVIKNGSGQDVSLDHHGDMAYENLFSNIHLGQGNRTYNSSGEVCALPHSGARSTFWNLKYTDPNKKAGPPFVSTDFPQANVIPGDRNLFSTNNEPWMEHISNITPLDLYQSQFITRMKREDVKPVGWLDYASATEIRGWSCDSNKAEQSLDVHIYLNGTYKTAIKANRSRPDLASYCDGTTAHGFSWVPTGFSPGTYTVEAYGIGVYADGTVANNNFYLDGNKKTFTIQASPTPKPVPGDTDNDGDVDIFDYNVVIANFGKSVTGVSKGDLDTDGDVDIFDYNLVIAHFGR